MMFEQISNELGCAKLQVVLVGAFIFNQLDIFVVKLIVFILNFLLLHFLEILNALKRFFDDFESFVADKFHFILGEEVWTYLIEYALECSDLSVETFCVLLVLNCLH